jgi:RHS repeat-associated protein
LAQPRRIEFIYDATGVKLRKTIFVNSVATDTTSYINGIEYKGKALDRFPHTEGAVVRQTDGTFQHEYTIKDHLGNARVTYIDKNADGKVDSTEIKQVNHYYAFGLNMEGNFNGASGTNKYQYNGKEWNDDFGLGLNDYGARFYDAAIGRFTAADPLSLMFAPMSPYQYARNSPINFVDPTGMASEAWTSINQANSNSSNQQTQSDNSVKTDQQKYNSINRSTDIEGSGTSITAVGYKSINPSGEVVKNVLEGFRIEGFKINNDDSWPPTQKISDAYQKLPFGLQASLNNAGTIPGFFEWRYQSYVTQLNRINKFNAGRSAYQFTVGSNTNALKGLANYSSWGRVAGRGLAGIGTIITISNMMSIDENGKQRTSYTRGGVDIFFTGVGVFGGGPGLVISGTYFLTMAVADYAYPGKFQ